MVVKQHKKDNTVSYVYPRFLSFFLFLFNFPFFIIQTRQRQVKSYVNSKEKCKIAQHILHHTQRDLFGEKVFYFHHGIWNILKVLVSLQKF
jgi:hypothetical protein